MAGEAKFTLRCVRVDPGVGAPSRMKSAGNYFPTLISTEYTLVALVPTLLRGNAVLAALRLDWEQRPGRSLDLFQNRALRSAVATLHKR